MNIKVIIFISFTAILITSCLTTGGSQYFESNNLESEAESEITIDSPVELPQFSLFVSAPYEEEELPLNELIIPVTAIPEAVEPVEPVSETVPLETVSESQVIAEPPVRTQRIPEPVGMAASEPQAEIKSVASTEPDPIDRLEPEIERSTAAQSVTEQSSEIINNLEAELQSFSGEEIIITLEKEGWIFDSSNSSGEVELRGREFSGGSTKFQFRANESGEFVLIFLLQNNESGNEERVSYNLKAMEKDSGADFPVVIDPSTEELEISLDETTDPALLVAVEEENVPDLVASIDQLISPESSPGSEILLNAFDLLEKQGGYDEYLVELAENSFRLYPYDHYSAEMLFRAAQGLEKPGEGQDIRKAVGLFKLVRDYFPLSVFSDRSEERIRYLERHFMKIY